MGVLPGDTVAIAADTSLIVFACIVGAWACGASVAMLPAATSEVRDASRVVDLVNFVNPKLCIGVADLLLGCDQIANVGFTTVEALAALALSPRQLGLAPPSDSVALIQLTSGSTGRPKGIGITHRMLEANCSAIAERVEIVSQDHVVSWLPLNHDMGFSAITVPLRTGATVTLIPPSVFMRSPWTWLDAISRQRGTISPSPAFAYSLMAKSARRLARANVDLSSLRYAWVGAEPIFASHLSEFETSMASFGLRPNVVKPAYGLAEGVVAVTCGDPSASYRVVHVDGRALRDAGLIHIEPKPSPNTIPFVSNGKPLSNVRVKVVSKDGANAPQGVEGLLFISGPSVAVSYLHGAEADKFSDGWFDTGDLGFIDEGEVFISGRLSDVIIRGGINLSPTRIEWAVEELLGLRSGQVAAFSVLDHEKSKEIVVVVVGRVPDEANEAEMRVRIGRAVAVSVSVQLDQIVFVRSASIPRTTSGKVQRGRAREMFLRNEFPSS